MAGFCSGVNALKITKHLKWTSCCSQQLNYNSNFTSTLISQSCLYYMTSHSWNFWKFYTQCYLIWSLIEVLTGSKVNSHELDVINSKLYLTITSKDILLYSRALVFMCWLLAKLLEGSTLQMYLDRKLCGLYTQSTVYARMDFITNSFYIFKTKLHA